MFFRFAVHVFVMYYYRFEEFGIVLLSKKGISEYIYFYHTKMLLIRPLYKVFTRKALLAFPYVPSVPASTCMEL